MIVQNFPLISTKWYLCLWRESYSTEIAQDKRKYKPRAVHNQRLARLRGKKQASIKIDNIIPHEPDIFVKHVNRTKSNTNFTRAKSRKRERTLDM